MRVSTLLLAEGVSVDVFTGRVTPFNLVETLFAPKFPARVTRLHVLVQYERAPESGVPHVFEKMELKDPTGVNVLQGPVQELTMTTRFHSSLQNAWNTILPSAGDYRLSVSHAPSADGPWSEQAWRTIVIEQAPHPLAPPAETK
jgi:hypothetical protein